MAKITTEIEEIAMDRRYGRQLRHTHINYDADVWDRLVAIARKREMTVSALVRTILDRGVIEEERRDSQAA
ncbi:MAG: hypothetical protein V1792_21820 [Pseudomonadota bacterium]